MHGKKYKKIEVLTPCVSPQTCLSLHVKQPYPFFAVWGCTLNYNLGSSDNKKCETPESKLTNLLPQEACEVGFNQGETLKLSTHL